MLDAHITSQRIARTSASSSSSFYRKKNPSSSSLDFSSQSSVSKLLDHHLKLHRNGANSEFVRMNLKSAISASDIEVNKLLLSSLTLLPGKTRETRRNKMNIGQ